MRKIDRNPFVDRYDHKMIGADRKKEVSAIVNSIEATSPKFIGTEHIQSKLIVVKAGYGVGKTFTAFHLKRILIREEGYLVSFFRLIEDQAKGVRTSNRDFISRVLKNLESGDVFKSELARLKIELTKEVSSDFSTMLNLSDLLYQKKLKNLVVLIDEAEDLLSAGKKKAVNYLTMLRNLYDSYVRAYSEGKLITPVSVVLFLSPDAWEVIMMNSDKAATRNAGAGLMPLVDRIGNQVYNLREFDKNDLRAFVVMMLNKVTEESEEVEPFRAEVIDGLYTITRGNPRRIIMHCHSLLERMLSSSKTEISLSDFRHYCKEKNIEMEGETGPTEDDDEFYGKF